MNDLEGFEQLIQGMDHLAQKLPGESLTKAVKKGANIVIPQVINHAPERTGTLRAGLILHKERNRTKGKVVYDVYPDPKKNAIFQKPIQKRVRSKAKHGYYPASQEHGFFTRRPDGGMEYVTSAGDTVHMDKVPGKHYMRTGAEVAGEMAKNAIAGSLLAEIEKEFGK